MTRSTSFTAIRNTTGAALLGLIFAVSLLAQNSDHKIDRSLMQALTDDADASAALFVVFGERANLTAASRIPDWAARGAAVAAALQSAADRSQAGVRGYLQGQRMAFTPYWVINAIYIPSGNLALARALARRPEVAAILPESVYSIPPAAGGDGDSIQAVQWNISMIRADQVWGVTSGTGIRVASIDTGVRFTHEALVTQFSGFFYDPTMTCGNVPCDNDGHGTHTMGTMVGGNGIGVAPGATWAACKGCITNDCYSSHLISCAQWVLAPGGLPGERPHVVNNSWGGPGGSTWFSSYVDSWRAAGVFPAFSAGNGGPSCGSAGSPGDNPQSYASGATDNNGQVGSFSGRGPSGVDGRIKPDVVAPGVNVLSCYSTSDTSYATGSGASMASPHTAGTVALVWAAQPALLGNVAATEQRLRDTAVKFTSGEDCGGTAGQIPNNTYGYGRIDAYAAAIGGGPPPNQPPTVTIDSPLSGSEFACPATVTFLGGASDPEQEDLSDSIQWFEGGQFGSGPAAVKSYSCTETGAHTITAKVTDAGGLSDTDTVTIYVIDASVPAAPTLRATVSGSTVLLSWDAVPLATSYRLERKSKGGWPTLADGIASTSYADTPGGGNWQYRMQACNSSGCSAYSNIVTARVKK